MTLTRKEAKTDKTANLPKWRSLDPVLLLVSLALVVGGAIGNLIDRMSSGAVTDFIDVYVGSYHWPSFNVADSAISVGIVLMAIDSFRSRKKTPERTS